MCSFFFKVSPPSLTHYPQVSLVRLTHRSSLLTTPCLQELSVPSHIPWAGSCNSKSPISSCSLWHRKDSTRLSSEPLGSTSYSTLVAGSESRRWILCKSFEESSIETTAFFLIHSLICPSVHSFIYSFSHSINTLGKHHQKFKQIIHSNLNVLYIKIYTGMHIHLKIN